MDAVPTHELVALCYQLMKAAAHRERRRWPRLQDPYTTELVHSAYLRLARQQAWASKEAFLAAAANTMRQILVDEARARLAQKRGGGAVHESLSDTEANDPEMLADGRLVELDSALSRLQALDPRLAQVVELRYFAGMGHDEAAGVLGVNERTVRRDWLKAKAWLQLHGNWAAD